METDNFDIQLARMTADIKNWGKEVTGIYRGVNWTTQRPYGTYLCGYIIPPFDIDDNMDEQLGMIAHGGITGGLTGEYSVGFDTMHYGDWAPIYNPNNQPYPGDFPEQLFRNMYQSGEYRNSKYVYEILKQMIDCVLDNTVIT